MKINGPIGMELYAVTILFMIFSINAFYLLINRLAHFTNITWGIKDISSPTPISFTISILYKLFVPVCVP